MLRTKKVFKGCAVKTDVEDNDKERTRIAMINFAYGNKRIIN